MASASKSSAFFEMCKPRIVLLVLITTGLGFFIALRLSSFQPLYLSDLYLKFTFLMLGTALTGAGSSMLNHYLERDVDGLMARTKNRPLVRGVFAPITALLSGSLLVISGALLLAWQVNTLCAFLSILTAFLYVLVYTPLKRLTWLNTSIGAIPGAIPPVGGWAAATGSLELGAWLLFVVMFLWQHPHFYSIAWIYREDYQRGGFKMLPNVDSSGEKTFIHIIVYCVILMAASFIPYFLNLTSAAFLLGSLLIGALFLASGCNFYVVRSVQNAKLVLYASIIYLPLWFGIFLADLSFWKI